MAPRTGRAVLRSLFVLWLGLALCSVGQAQAPSADGASRAALGAPEKAPLRLPVTFGEAASAGRLGRVASIVGVASAGLLWGGAVAIAWADDPGSERITRSVHLGVTAIAAPSIALAAFLERRRAGAEGIPALRSLGWAFYSFAVAGGVFGVYDAFHDDRTPRWMTLFSGALGALSVLTHSFDAFLCGRHARLKSYTFSASPFGLGVTF